MIITGIDPGSETSGYVVYDTSPGKVLLSDGAVPNEHLLSNLPGISGRVVLIEGVSARGGVMGWTTVQTIEWVGRFYEAYSRAVDIKGFPVAVEIYYRDDIKRQLLGRVNMPKADAHIRQHLIDTIGPPGKKASPGPTYGVTKHAWQALGIVQAYLEREQEAAA